MDAGTIITSAVGIAACVGGYFGGKRLNNSTAVETAVGVVDLLQVQIKTLESDREDKGKLISKLQVRIEVLESLVTQRADVETVAEEVAGVRGVVDRIAEKMGA